MTNTISKVQLISIFEAIATSEGEIKDMLQLIADKELFIDNHNYGIIQLTKEKFALLLLKGSNGIKYLCPAYKNKYFCMNEMYKGDDEMVHLSTCSVAGTINRCTTNQDLIEQCDLYNEDSVYGPKVEAVIELQ